jgi:hypothetical protein
MVNGAERPDARLEQGVHQTAVIIHAFCIHGAASGRLHPRPRRRKPVALLVQPLHDGNVFPVTVELVASDVAVRAIANLPLGVGEAVPDRFTLPIGIPSSFDLIGRGGRAPEKPFWKPGLRDIGFVAG